MEVVRDELNKLINPDNDVEQLAKDAGASGKDGQAQGVNDSDPSTNSGSAVPDPVSESGPGDPASLTPYKPSKIVFGTYRALLRNMQNQLLSFDRVFEWLVDGANARRALVMNFHIEDFGGSLRKMGRPGARDAVQELMRWKKSYQHAILEDGVESIVGDAVEQQGDGGVKQ